MIAEIVGMRLNLDIRWAHEYDHIAYILRGWYPHWRMLVRSFTEEQIWILCGVATVYLWSAVSIHRAAR